ncbi:hypothetical protein KCP70_09215 [Salmonella enterica subsp. enterica]|nr:hypothetical protein KCP70_09215 [Salmonella enterica subsp. enterica]
MTGDEQRTHFAGLSSPRRDAMSPAAGAAGRGKTGKGGLRPAYTLRSEKLGVLAISAI